MKIFNYRLAFFFFFSLVAACNEAHNHQAVILAHPEKFSDTASFVLQIDSVSTIADTFASENASATASFYDRKTDELLYYLYNHTSGELRIYSLTTKRFLKGIALKKDGATSIGNLQALFCNTADSIFILDEAYIALIDSTGTIKTRWPINERGARTQPFFEKYVFYTRPPSIFHYDKSTRCIYVQAYERAEFDPKSGFKTKESPGRTGFIAKYDLAAKRPDMLPVSYAAQYSTNYYGNMLQPSVNFIHAGQNCISYIFPVSPGVYTQQLNSDTANEYACLSSISTNSVEPLTWDDIDNEDLKVRHFHRNVNFCRLVYTDSPACYYRFHYDKMDSGDNDFQNVYAKKKLFLTVIDNHFSICKELSMPIRNIHTLAAFSAKGTVYIPMVDPLRRKRNFLQFLTLKIDKK
ncbi:DUF4221 family protein [Niastella populi]|uniref:DUF4221 domain-containing protein n=1 Tax=Niastella populi TaxID=550983 RepID=A0A1V9FNB3_9BACT|nr:DUF4221 family protein [Niastella populi]OQP59830.1 hypothetical protein A4R26_20815 [Niastella populi]